MNFNLQILGTASAMPISDRNPSAQALQVQGRLFLIDCGEGVQQQMRRQHLSFLKVEAICISHIHGDHIFGIFGLLSTMGMLGRSEVLHIFAPESFGPILKFFLSYFGEGVNYEIVHHPLSMKEPEIIYENKHLTIKAFPLQHKIPCFGFRFDEKVKPRPAFLDGVEGLPAPKPPRSYAYCSDTMPFPELPEWVRGVNVLYHEATYMKDLEDKAAERFHSTTEQAARCALEAGAQKLIVAHYSSRIREIEPYLAECKAIFPETVAANDGDIFQIDYIRV